MKLTSQGGNCYTQTQVSDIERSTINMNLPGYYSSGQFARMANVSVRTIRFYDKQNILHRNLLMPP